MLSPQSNIIAIPVLLLYIAFPTLLLSFLQLFLCRKELKWGRILPIFSAVVSVLAGLTVVLFSLNVGTGFWWIIPAAALTVLVVFNIPTLIFYLIYRSARKKRDQEDLNRMKIDDLE